MNSDRKRYNPKKWERLKSAKYIVAVFVVVLIASRFAFGLSFVDGASMEPTYHTKDVVIYNRLDKTINKGDIVSIKMPSGSYIIKRVVATANDIVDLKEDQLYVNGEVVANGYEAQSVMVEYPLQLEEDQLFILGDNALVSIDSRTFGAMSSTQVRGKIMFHIPLSGK